MEKQFDKSGNLPRVPVAIPLQHDMSKVDIPIPNIYAHPSLATVTTLPNIASFCLPCSRGIGELTPVTKRQIQQLVDQG